MKLQKLIIHNIASIEDAVIDFEAQPLAGSEVFLITGKTGAGKSTILDAICLALFADTPRLENTQMQGKTKESICMRSSLRCPISVRTASLAVFNCVISDFNPSNVRCWPAWAKVQKTL
jgi:DNA repair exonuclease SbcCD ATPase subunit